MIEILEGTHETVRYGNNSGVKMYHNTDYEDYPEHWHTSIEIIMPLAEDYTVTVGEGRYCLKEGEIIIINSGVLHELKAPPKGERIILQFSDFLLYYLKEMETMLNILPPVIYLSPENDRQRLYSFVKRQMDSIIVEYDEEKAFFNAVIYAKLIEIFVHIGRNVISGGRKNKNQVLRTENNPEKKKEYMETIMSACNYINQHYQEALSLEEVAEFSGFSKFHFTRIFKQCMNMTFYEYLNQKRISKAEELLSTTGESVTEIAMSSGFSSISAFNRTFKSIKGCSPSEYRGKSSTDEMCRKK